MTDRTWNLSWAWAQLVIAVLLFLLVVLRWN
jgi:hypothetical protein